MKQLFGIAVYALLVFFAVSMWAQQDRNASLKFSDNECLTRSEYIECRNETFKCWYLKSDSSDNRGISYCSEKKKKKIKH